MPRAVARHAATLGPPFCSIPRHVWQTSHLTEDALPPIARANRIRMQRDNPEWSFHLVNDTMASAFIHSEFSPTVANAYDSLRYGVAKADFWRYCVLYVHGGVYVDVDSALISPLDHFIRAELPPAEWHQLRAIRRPPRGEGLSQ